MTIRAFLFLRRLLLILKRRKETEDEARFRGHVEKKLRTGQLINSFDS